MKCDVCALADMLGAGQAIQVTGVVDLSHADCEHGGCECECEYARGARCGNCGRSSVDAELDADGHCTDVEACARRMFDNAASPPRPEPRRVPTPLLSGDELVCGCGCETPKSTRSRYLPGHDAKHLSRLVAEVRGGGATLEDAVAELAHSAKLRAKLRSRLERTSTT